MMRSVHREVHAVLNITGLLVDGDGISQRLCDDAVNDEHARPDACTALLARTGWAGGVMMSLATCHHRAWQDRSRDRVGGAQTHVRVTLGEDEIFPAKHCDEESLRGRQGITGWCFTTQ
jgi:hypothetical protein